VLKLVFWYIIFMIHISDVAVDTVLCLPNNSGSCTGCTVLFVEKECLRYDREFLLQLRFSAESQRKPAGLPQMPEIIIDAVICFIWAVE